MQKINDHRDTVGASLGYTMYYLAKYPRVRRKLQNGLSTVHGKSVPGEFTHADLRTIGYLDAVINESLRMDSPAGNNASRMTPPEGIVINGTVIPGDIAVYVGIYSASHCEISSELCLGY
jgi:cytochrome P450